MLGDFHPFSQSPGIHNPDFRPLKSPIPMLVIRHMVISDWLFLLEKNEWLQAWFARFHAGQNPKTFLDHVWRLSAAMEKIRQQKEG